MISRIDRSAWLAVAIPKVMEAHPLTEVTLLQGTTFKKGN